MSRSRRKHPCFHIGSPKNKKVASKLVRRYRGELGSHSFYKKLYESYDIIDWIDLSYEQLRKNKEFRKAARIIRDIYKGRVPVHKYNLRELVRILEDTKDSFLWTNKK